MEKRYQVFVSSTYIDLVEARNEVMQALLELDCMPAGMELFPAANDDQWTWIKRVIDESDYYIVIIGGRYGSVSEATKLSFTEMEYRYAVERGKPVIGFLHEDPSLIPAKSTEQDQAKRDKLQAFRSLVQSRLCKYWSSPADLGAKVSRSVTQLLKQYPAAGWIKADQIPTLHTSDEILRLRQQIDALQKELQQYRTQAAPAPGTLASGGDRYDMTISFKRKEQVEKDGRKSWRVVGQAWIDVPVTWDAIFGFLAPSILNGATNWDMDQLLDRLAFAYGVPILEKREPDHRFEEVAISGESQRVILIHLRALKLITLSEDGRKWMLTDHGDQYMTQILAVHKPASAPNKRRKSK